MTPRGHTSANNNPPPVLAKSIAAGDPGRSVGSVDVAGDMPRSAHVSRPQAAKVAHWSTFAATNQQGRCGPAVCAR